MGVKLGEILEKKQIQIEDLSHKSFAVDSSNIIYQFLSSIRQADGTPLMDSSGNITSHLVGLSSRISNLIAKNLRLCFVFDGKSPELKVSEQIQREKRKVLAQEKLQEAKEQGDEGLMYKYSMQTTRLTQEIIKEAKELILAFGLPIVNAPSEAEAQAAFMAKNKDVYGVISQDFDSLVFGTPVLVRNLTISQKRRVAGVQVKVFPELIDLKENLKLLDIDQKKLIILAIMVGTDFNSQGIKGIGPKKALKIVRQRHDYDKIFEELQADFDWKEIYSVFEDMPTTDNYKLEWHEVDEEKIRNLLVDRHDFSLERVEKIFDTISDNKSKHKGQTGLDKWF